MKAMAADSTAGTNKKMNEGSLGVVETSEPKSVPAKRENRKGKSPFLVGTLVLIALAISGVEVLSSRKPPVREHSQPSAEVTVTVVHPQKASISIPRLPGQT